MGDAAQGRAALAELRRARRRRRVAALDWFDAAYHVYLTAILVIVAVLFVSSFVGDAKASDDGLARVLDDGPGVIGIAAALAVSLGVRSGSRGGPLAIEPAEVNVVLLAPVDRGVALRAPARQQLRFGAFAGAATGAIAGQLAVRRLGAAPLAWVAAGALAGTAIAVAGLGAALVAGGTRWPRWAGTVAAAGLTGSAVAAAAAGAWSPWEAFGDLALWPLRWAPAGLGAVAAAAVLAGVGLALVGGTAVEAIEHRTALVRQLRFAVTVRDLRAVVLLRRQLSLDLTRDRPWLRLRRAGGRDPVRRRGWQGIARFPVARLARMAALGAVAGLAARGVWDGTTPLVVAGAAALYLAALDATEPLAQEVDQAERSEQIPIERGRLHLRHLVVPPLVMVPVALCGAGAAVAAGPSGRAVALAAVAVLPAAACATAGAVTSVVLPPPQPLGEGLIPPEAAGMRIVLRTAWPLVIAAVGLLPVAAGRAAADAGSDPVAATAVAAAAACIPAAFTVAWVRFREPAKAWWQASIEQAQAGRAPTTKAVP